MPIGTGRRGIINALAVSPDGRCLAASGLGVVRNEAGFQQHARMYPIAETLDAKRKRDRGMIYLFDTKEPGVRLLRGHEGVVFALAFAPDERQFMVSAAWEPRKEPNTSAGRVYVWDIRKNTSADDKDALAEKEDIKVAEWPLPDRHVPPYPPPPRSE